MANTKVFRDPIHSQIAFDKKEDKPILQIIDTPEFQRLRRIRQLGLVAYTFPTATHDRFSHSLGVCFLAGELFDNLNVPAEITVQSPQGAEIALPKKHLKLLLKLAALLHDIGHGPFSHAFENITEIDHEKLSIEIIKNRQGNIRPILESIENHDLKKHAVDWIADILNGFFKPIWARELISSQLDADRMDYLLRDAYMCGVNYASFDLKWLFHNMEIGEIEGENRKGLLINGRGIHAVESFIVSRHHMYAQVYFHKTTRGFDLIIQKIFERLKNLMERKALKANMFLNQNLIDFVANQNLEAYFTLDDFSMYAYFNHWIEVSEDDILKTLCKAIIYRKPYKMVEEIEGKEYRNLKKVFDNSEELEDYYYFVDDYSNMAYKDISLLGQKPTDRIYLKNSNGKLTELAEASTLVGSIRNKKFKTRKAYIHKDFYPKYLEQYPRLNKSINE